MTRLMPKMPFPPYSFVPGKAPHPHSDPAGHSYGATAIPPAPVEPDRWQESQTYLYALDLFNGQYFWECHEQLEGLWLAAGRTGPVADFLKGLIKLAAAGVKHLEEVPAGVRSHAGRAAELFLAVAEERGEGLYFGLAVQELVDLAEKVQQQGWPDPTPLLYPVTPLF